MSVLAVTAGSAVSTLMQNLPGIISKLDHKNTASADSLIEYTRSTRNDFLTVVEDSLVAVPYMPDVMQSVLSIVSGYFLSAVSLVVDVPGIEVVNTLDRLNANRDPIENVLGTGSSILKAVGTESLAYGLPKHNIAIEQFSEVVQRREAPVFAKEAFDDLSEDERRELEEKQRLEMNDQRLKAQRGGESSVGIGRDSVATLKEVTNLSVGKVFNITFARNGNSLDVPVTLSLAVTNTDAESMYNIVTFNAQNASMKDRYYRAKAGELSYVKDLLFCQDMIEEARRQRIKDKSGFLESMMRRSRKNFWSGLFSAKTSLNNASSVLVLSEDTARRAALELGGKLDRFQTREKVFKNTACMLLVVVDTKWETVRIYHRSLNNYTELSVRELKRSAKGGGNDVEEILKAYSAGSAPIL